MALSLALSLAAGAHGAAHADTPAGFAARFTAQAASAQPGFTASAERGREFFARRFNVSGDFPSCTACHTTNPAAEGRHAVTAKRIAALAPAANVERLADATKVERWFRRNCTEVVGRECSAAEKADFVVFLMGVKP